MDGPPLLPPQDRGVKEDELQSILNYLLTMHEVKGSNAHKHNEVKLVVRDCTAVGSGNTVSLL